ncbi:MAG: VCBS repeat-containing protein [Planctomycetaceae bacterium]|nr:VCBS repeat-containing protein [Planctomycetales bacterium]MCB9926645.1 VCBS repeat-containing protein [Planctomycetaceae bacterium]
MSKSSLFVFSYLHRRSRRPGRLRLFVEHLEDRLLLKTPFMLDGLFPDAGGDGTEGSIIFAESPRTDFGASFAGGDFNGDGIGDIAVGSPNANNGRGRVDVIFGSEDHAAALDLSSLRAGAGFVLLDTSASFAHLGSTIDSPGDLNKDGIDDLVVDSYVVFGSRTPPTESLDLKTLDGQAGFRVTGFNGTITGLGDFNGDAVNDLLIDNLSGNIAYVLFGGRSTWDAEISVDDLDVSTGTLIKVGEVGSFSPSYRFIEVGDINADGRSDMFITRMGYGEMAWVLYGRTTPGAQIDIATTTGITNVTSPTGNLQVVSGAGDVNGDGVSDLLAADWNSQGHVYVAFGRVGGFGSDFSFDSLDGGNGFVVSGVESGTRFGFTAQTAGDLNGDGFDDLSIAAPLAESQKAFVLFGRADGFSANLGADVFDGVRGFAIESSNPLLEYGDVIRGIPDFNNDGFDDLLIRAIESESVGSSNTTDYVVIVSGKDYEDALPKIAAVDTQVTEATDRLRFELNAPWYYPVTTSKSANSGKLIEAEAVRIVEVADLNGDHLLDLAILADVVELPSGFGSARATEVLVMLNNGDNSYAPALGYKANRVPDLLRVVDVDGDGDIDLVTVSDSEDSISILLNRGDGTFEQAINFGAGTNPTGLEFVDVDGDLDLDAIVATNDSSAYGVSVLFNLGGGFFDTPSLTPLDRRPLAFAIADVDQNNSPDVITLNAKPSGFTIDPAESVSVLLNDGAGTFTSGASVELRSESVVRSSPQFLVVADFDKDNDIDVLVSDVGEPGLWIIPGGSDGSFNSPRHQPLAVPPVNIHAGDFNNDGYIDAILDSDNHWLTLATNKKELKFDTSEQLVASPGAPGATFVDWDNDGDLDILRPAGDATVDLFRSSGLPEQVMVIRNNDGKLAAGRRWSVGPAPAGLAFADFDDDGNLDIAVANSGDVAFNISADSVTILYGDGSAAIHRSEEVNLGATPTAFTAADFDGDGDTDLAFATPASGGTFGGGGGESESLRVMLNQGDGVFAEARAFAADGFIEDMLSRDVDNDGDIDVIAVAPGGGFGGESFGRIMLFLNNGSGLFFRRDTDLPRPLLNYDVADLNGDAFVDVLASWQSSLPGYKTAILFGRGAGSFDSPVEVGGSGFAGRSSPGLHIELADFTGDGVLDAAIQDFSEITVVPSVAAEVPGQPIVTHLAGIPGASSSTDYGSFFSADVDRDGDMDLIATEGRETFGGSVVAAGNAVVFLNQGNGSFDRGLAEPELITIGQRNEQIELSVEQGVFVPLGSFSHLARMADLNGDALPELISVDSQGGNVTVYENTSVGVTHATFEVQLDRTFDREVRVDFSTRPGSAAARLDYQTTTKTLIIPPGQISASTAIEIDDDSLDEPTEEFVIDLLSPFNGSISNDTATIQITDNDAILELMLSVTQLPTSGGTVDVMIVRRDQGNLGELLSVDLSSPSAAFAALPESVTIAANADSETVTLTLAPTVSGTIALLVEAAGFVSANAALTVVNDSPNPWHNTDRPFDVNGDGAVSPVDALIIINFLNSKGSQTLSAPTAGNVPPPYLDPSGDSVVAPIDVLQIINFLNGGTALEGEGPRSRLSTGDVDAVFGGEVPSSSFEWIASPRVDEPQADIGRCPCTHLIGQRLPDRATRKVVGNDELVTQLAGKLLSELDRQLAGEEQVSSWLAPSTGGL